MKLLSMDLWAATNIVRRLYAKVVVPSAPVRLLSQLPFDPNVTSATSVDE